MNDSQVRPPNPKQPPSIWITFSVVGVVAIYLFYGCDIERLKERVERLEQQETNRQIISIDFNGTNIWTRP